MAPNPHAKGTRGMDSIWSIRLHRRMRPQSENQEERIGIVSENISGNEAPYPHPRGTRGMDSI